MKLQLDSKHLAVIAIALLGTFGASLLPPGSLASFLAKLGPWAGLVTTALALLLKSILPAANAPAPATSPGTSLLGTVENIATIPDGAAKAAKKDQAGFVKIHPLLWTCGIISTVLIVCEFTLVACGANIPPKIVTAGIDGIKLGICILDQPTGSTPEQIIAACPGATQQFITDTFAAADKRAARKFACLAQDAGRD